MMPKLKQLIAENGLEDRVALRGAYAPAQLNDILANADIVVLPSTWEGLPLVLVEAMQRGVPIVTTNAGGSAEFGDANPDVVVTDIEWSSFTDGLLEMARRLRAGQIDPARLYEWAESRYGY